MSAPKNIVLLGASGSIGESTLKVLRSNPETLSLTGIAANRRWEALAPIAKEFGVKHIGLFDEDALKAARQSGAFSPDTCWHTGTAGLSELATLEQVQTVVMAVVGTAGLIPSLDALAAGKTLALASKEVLVKAGKFVMETARRHAAPILPVDSEHNALYQCMQGHPSKTVAKLWLTASGGPFLDRPLASLAEITPDEALVHPNWDMGPKVTIDSSTMANKGLELIEARWLYDMPANRLNVVIHPQSIVHSMVEFRDGSILGHLSPPCMTFPIQHCLFYPDRSEGTRATLDFSEVMQLEFRPVEKERFVCFELARQALATDGVAPAVFNAANEVAVDAFATRQLPYLKIPDVIDKTLASMELGEPETLESVLEADAEARARAATFIQHHGNRVFQ